MPESGYVSATVSKKGNKYVIIGLALALILIAASTVISMAKDTDEKLDEQKETVNTVEVETAIDENSKTEQVDTSTSTKDSLLSGLGTGVTGYRDIYYPVGQIPDRFELLSAKNSNGVTYLILEDFRIDGFLMKFTLVNPSKYAGTLTRVELKVNYNTKDNTHQGERLISIRMGKMLANERRPMTIGQMDNPNGNIYIEGITLVSDIR